MVSEDSEKVKMKQSMCNKNHRRQIRKHALSDPTILRQMLMTRCAESFREKSRQSRAAKRKAGEEIDRREEESQLEVRRVLGVCVWFV